LTSNVFKIALGQIWKLTWFIKSVLVFVLQKHNLQKAMEQSSPDKNHTHQRGSGLTSGPKFAKSTVVSCRQLQSSQQIME